MSRRLFNVLALALAGLMLLFGAVQVFAAPAAGSGSGPDNPAAAPSGSVTLQPGQRAWYGFQYAGDRSQIMIDMNNPDGNASFMVWTPDNLRNWQQGNGETAIGRGTSDSFVNGGDLIWSGNFDMPGTYLVVVTNNGSAPATFTMTISGTGVAAVGK